jgi:NitT/TauT family transport system substrate-binding protein
MAFIPNVQFAPFYVADDKGYFAAEGIKPIYDYGFEQDVVALTAQDQLLFTNAGGTTTIIARSHDVPVQYFIKEYQTLPIAVFGLKDKGVSKMQDLKGKTIGQALPSGETFVGFAIMMRKAGLKDSDVNLTTIGFTQVESVLNNKVDAAVGYSVNEPLQLRAQGKEAFELDMKDVAPEVAGDGIIASENTLRNKPELARGFARAFLKGLADTIQDPEAAFTTTLKFVPDAGKDETVKKAQHDILLKVVNEYWKTSGKLGQSDPKLWEQTQTVLKETGFVDKETDMGRAVTNAFLPN